MLYASLRFILACLLLPCIAASLPIWQNDTNIRSLISSIFGPTDNIDIVINEDRESDLIGFLIRDVFGGLKSFRTYGEQLSAGAEGCISDRSLLSANVLSSSKNAQNTTDTMDRDYDEEYEFIQWDHSYEKFVKIWDQNHHDGYIVFANLSTFEDLLKCLLDPAGIYLLVLDPGETYESKLLFSLFKSIWDHQGVNRMYILTDEQLMYTFDPFLPNGSSFGVMKQLNASEGLPSIPRRDFLGYPFRVDMFRSVYTWSEAISGKNSAMDVFAGADVVVCETFVETLNLTVKHIPPDKDQFGDRLPNGSYSGVIGRIGRRESDIGFVGFFIKDYFSRDIEFTSGVYTDEICCLVKKASRIPEYLLPITIFPADVWGLLFLAGMVCTVVWIVLRAGIRAKSKTGIIWTQERRLAYLFNLSNETRDAPWHRKLYQICVDTYILLLSAPYRRFTRSGIERLLLFGIMMVSLVFVSMFQSGLASVFVNPVYYKDISDLQQLDETGMRIPVKYKGFLDDVFPANYSPMMTSLRNKMMFKLMAESALQMVSRVGTVCTVTRKTTLALDNAIYISTRQLFMIPECPRTYNLAYVITRHSVLAEKVNEVLLRMLNGGLINYWVSQMNYNVTLNDLEQVRSAQESSFKVLNILDMQFPFYLLVMGIGISVIAFIGEHIYYRLLT